MITTTEIQNYTKTQIQKESDKLHDEWLKALNQKAGTIAKSRAKEFENEDISWGEFVEGIEEEIAENEMVEIQVPKGYEVWIEQDNVLILEPTEDTEAPSLKVISSKPFKW